MPDTPWLSIRSAELSAEIDPQGSQLSSLRDGAGRDLLWNGDPAIWNGRAPLLFPIVGMLAGGHYRLGAREYALSRHGFARGKPFEVIGSTGTHAALRLAADAATLEIYPFRFELETQFSIDAATLSVRSLVRNRGSTDMPASFGYHPALRWPLPYGQRREAHFIEFESDEPDPIRRLDAGGLLSPEAHPTPIVQRRLVLSDALFEPDVVIFDRVSSRYVSYGAESGPRIRVSYPDMPYLGVWTKPGSGFICIEPWHGFSDPVGYDGDFRKKPGSFIVPPGGEKAMTIAISLQSAR